MNRLILFYRPAGSPSAARVKTRIAAEIGPEGAGGLYRAMLADLAENLAAFEDILFPTAAESMPESGPGEQSPWTPAAFQRGRDLGIRMENGFRDAFSGGIQRAVLIGSDIPHIEPATIQRSFTDLERFDTVLGPALDGGYYLIGLTGSAFRRQASFGSSPGPSRKGIIFEDIPWSTEGVFTATLGRIETAGLSVSVLPVMRDLDTFEDVGKVLAGHGDRLPELTRAFASVCRE